MNEKARNFVKKHMDKVNRPQVHKNAKDTELQRRPKHKQKIVLSDYLKDD